MPIFDQGYQHWSGELSGHAWRWWAITRHGLRVGAKNRPLRLLLIFSWMPAFTLAFLLCMWGLLERKSSIVAPLVQVLSFMRPEILADPRHYRVQIWTICYHFFLLIELYSSMLAVLMVGPSLISQDMRFNALPLYFSRPLRRIDYFVGKLGVIVVFLGRMTILPCVIAYVLGLLCSLDVTIVGDTFPLLLASVVYGLVISVSAGLLILALSSLSRNSRYVALLWLGMWFVSGIVATTLEWTNDQQQRHARYAAQMEWEASEGIPSQQDGRGRRQRAWRQAQPDVWDEIQNEVNEASKTDWRLLTSYTSNLSRVGEHLLGTNRAWSSLAQLLPPSERARFLFFRMGPQYPWTWSVAVLLGLFGLSACILNLQVKSLDRLK